MKKTILVIFSFITIFANANTYNIKFHVGSLGYSTAGYLNLRTDFDFATSSNWSLGPSVHILNHNEVTDNNFDWHSYDIKTFNLGLAATWFLNGVFQDGLYVSPVLSYRSTSVKSKSPSVADLNGTLNGANITCSVGYGWFWNNFNQMLGLRLSKDIDNTKIKFTDASGAIIDEIDTLNYPGSAGIDIEYTLGWAF